MTPCRRTAIRAAAALLLLLVVTGCGSRPARTALTILAVNQNVGRSIMRLECQPSGGDLPTPARSCAAIAANPSLLTASKAFVCAGGPSSWWDVTISGRLDGRPFRRDFSTCWTPQMALIGRLGLPWQVLQGHLLPRRIEAVLPGTVRTFAAGALRPGDAVRCDIRGHHLIAGIPTHLDGGSESAGFDSSGMPSLRLVLSADRNGELTAKCGVDRGNR